MRPICLITPPSAFLIDSRVFVTLGILRVGAVLRDAGHYIEHLDLSGVENYSEAVLDHVTRSTARTFGVTATTPQMPDVMKIVEAIRTANPKARVILGGPHATLVNAARRREVMLGETGRASRAMDELFRTFDCIVAGDGEKAVFHALNPEAPKLIDADDRNSVMFLTNESYDEVPWPARELVDMGSYHYQIEGKKSASLIAQLGCPYQCGFCGGRETAMLRQIRTRSTENIVAEIEHLYTQYGYTGHMMYDDELNVSKSMVELMDEIAALQARLGVEFRLRGFIKSNLFTQEQADAMRRAGFRWILVGFESGSPKILKNIRKMATREQNDRCMEIARRAGLKVKALMSIGHPGESAETVEDTKQWLLEQRPDDFDCTIITTYPGTPYYDHARETKPGVWTYITRDGDSLHSVDVDFNRTADYYKGAPGEYKSYVYTDYLNAEELVTLRDDLEAEVRAKLGIPYNAGAPGVTYEHSMGQRGPLPPNILRIASPNAALTNA